MNQFETVALAKAHISEAMGLNPEIFTLESAKMSKDKWIVALKYEDQSVTLQDSICKHHPRYKAVVTISQDQVSNFETVRE